ncbi:NUDIX domain-containing protein [Sphingomonas sabuli]|uniref:NUDIX domain-containing protein n=1 Tax=Sphingomonas sabuli TaxID=2764186 RepID=A0A7G9L4Q1_9SPHN|nr:NUDIX domain-containing protein [Sphingomonas sabuli]QNM83600.1 NUDIX domain-containing protein [Sphingomonas sabuli]
MKTLIDGALRLALTAVQKMRTGWWFVRRPQTLGAHAIALTPAGQLVLVKLRYAPGWRVPGGGRKADEEPVKAALRELREEIGMHAHGSADAVCDLVEETDFRRDTCSLVLVRDVAFKPRRWTLEVQDVRAFDLDALPTDTSDQTRRWIAAARDVL